MKILLVAASLIGGILAAQAHQAGITSGPQDLTINAGSTADFIVTATNATSYQWSFQGTDIPGATNAELNFSDVSTNQAGLYSVVVGDSAGPEATNSANLTVLQGTIVDFRISGFASGPSNILVELFDHDKPATVQNFIHYIISDEFTHSNEFVPGAYTRTYSTGLYSNMYFDRLIPGFVLQGGSWVAQDRTDPTNKLVTDTIDDVYAGGLSFVPSFPQNLASEFYVGPKVSNRQGTIAMALPPGNVNGASDAFYFNLVDNTNLDTASGGGPFTVFGRVLSGSNVLAYFNNTNFFFEPAFTKLPTHNIFTNGIFDYGFLGYSVLNELPVNYHGTNYPADSNLFFVDFSFPQANAQPVIDTTPPTAAITFPPANVILTNGISLTVRGTAQDDVGLAQVQLTLLPQNGALGGSSGLAIGTTNWSYPEGVLEPGIYYLLVTYQDGAGNVGSPLEPEMIISAVLTNGVGSVSVTNVANHTYASDAVGANLRIGTNYAFGAQPGPGQFFVNWTYGTNVSFNPNLTVKFASNMVLTANFLSNSVPGGIAFTNPPVGGNTTNGSFPIAGVIEGGLLTPPVTVTCRLFSATNQQLVGPVRQIKATNNWSFPLTNLALGSYYAVVTAQDALGQATVIANDFTAGLPMTVLTNGNGRGTISPKYNGQFLVEGQHYSMTAAAAAGSLFDTWSDGVKYTNNRVVSFIMAPGLVLTATFVSNDFPGTIPSPIAFTYPTAGARLTNQTFYLAGTLNPALTNPVVSYQLFYGSNSVTAPSATNVTIIPGTAPARTTWSAGLTNLAPGYYTVVATVSDATGRSALISESFQVLAQVLLQINPPGYGLIASNKANWTGQFMSVGGPYTIAAETNRGYVFAFWSNNLTGSLIGNNPLAITVTTNMALTANFDSNYFFNVAGTYNGLFLPSDPNSVISPTNSGYYTLTVTSNGAISLKLCSPALTNTATGQFPLYNPGGIDQPGGIASAAFFWKGLGGKFVTNYVNLNLTNGAFPPYSLFGEVTNAEFSSSLQAFRAAPRLTGGSAVVPGTNVFSIPGDHSATNNQPGGDGYASFTLGANGAVTLIGYLADNTSFSQSTEVSTNYLNTNGIWPFYASLYGGKGIILGWETNTSPTNFEGAVLWSKPAIPAKPGIYYTNAFVFLTNSSSSSYTPPVTNTHYQIAFGGASLTNGLTNTFTVTNGLVFHVDPGQTNGLALAFIPKSGVLTGHFSYPSIKVTHNFYGAFISPALGGSGYFLDTNSETGWFEIQFLP